MFEILVPGAWLLVIAIYLGISFEFLEAGEMGEVMLLGRHFKVVGPGPKILPRFFFQLRRFPTLQLPLTLHVPIVAANADRANFYVSDRVVKFSDLDKHEQDRLMADPLSHRSLIVVEISVLMEFVSSELYEFIVKIGDFERLGSQLGMVIKNTLEGIFGRITINTALEEKEALQPLFKERLSNYVKKEGMRPWGVKINESLIGPIELEERIKAANSELSAAFAEKRRRIVLAEAREREIALEGIGRASAVNAMQSYLRTPEGRQAASLSIIPEIYKGADKIILGDMLASIKEMFSKV